MIEIGAYRHNPIKNVIFKLDGEEKLQMIPTRRIDGGYSSKCTDKAVDKEEHFVEIIVEPKDEKYSPLVLNFKIKWSEKE